MSQSKKETQDENSKINGINEELLEEKQDWNKKTIIVIGPTGVGKSTLCNVMSGRRHNDIQDFEVSSSEDSCTKKTSRKEVEWRGNRGCPVSLIDTPGLCDSSGTNFDIIMGMVNELEKVNHVDVFILVVNGTTLDFSRYFINMILIFRLCFGPEFLQNNTIIAVTNRSYNKAEAGKVDSDETLKNRINEKLKAIKNDINLDAVFIDATAAPFPDHTKGLRLNPAREKYFEEMKKLKTFMAKVQPYNCREEQFKDVKALMHELHYELIDKSDEIQVRIKDGTRKSTIISHNAEQLEQLQEQLGCFASGSRKEDQIMMTVFAAFVLVALALLIMATVNEFAVVNWTEVIFVFAIINSGLAIFSTSLLIWKYQKTKKKNLEMKDRNKSPLLGTNRPRSV